MPRYQEVDTEKHWQEQADRMRRTRRLSAFAEHACDREHGEATFTAWKGVCIGMLIMVALVLAVWFREEIWDAVFAEAFAAIQSEIVENMPSAHP